MNTTKRLVRCVSDNKILAEYDLVSMNLQQDELCIKFVFVYFHGHATAASIVAMIKFLYVALI